MVIFNLGFRNVVIGFINEVATVINMVFLQQDVHGQQFTGTTQSN